MKETSLMFREETGFYEIHIGYICIYIIKKKPESVFELQQGDVCISSVTLAELYYGVEKSQCKDRNKLALMHFLAPVEVLAFSEKAALSYGEIRAELEKKGEVIGVYDMMIAAHCISENMVLVSNNVNEFCGIEALKLENWV